MTSRSYRTPEGGRIDRSKRLRFRFDGEVYYGHPGDTLASALLANGVHLVGRSFKYHRPRGIVSAGSEEPNALVQLEQGGGRSDPNFRATQVELFEGLNATSQNRWPSLKYDTAAINDMLSPVLPAGFYYKTFMWPESWWKSVYEPKIRSIAGLGRSPQAPDPDRYLHRHAHCDVLVVGGGPAGLLAARTAGRTGARVILVDDQPEFGGSSLSESGTFRHIDDGLQSWRDKIVEDLRQLENVETLTRTSCNAYYDHSYLTLLERLIDHLPPAARELPRQRLWRVRAKQVILATGSIERPLVFPDNDRPGIMLASAARTYALRYGVLPGRQVVLFTNNDTAYETALDLAARGAAIIAIVDSREAPGGPVVEAAKVKGIEIHAASAIVGTEGRHRIRRCWVSRLDGIGERTPLGCDLLLVSGGWNPNVSLFSQSRGKLRFDDKILAFVPDVAAQATICAGSCNGTVRLDSVVNEAVESGNRAAQAAGFAAGQPPEIPRANDVESGPISPMWRVPAERGKAFVDFQNDVTTKDLDLALREGFRSVEHVKRFTTTGMGTDQGKTSNVNALAIVAAGRGIDIPSVGTTTFRPPYTPLTFGAMVGHNRGPLFDVVRKTPMHHLAEAKGAVFEDVGNWKRARYFPTDGEDMHAAVQREAKAVRTYCGMFDATTLGKIDLKGRDVRTFLNRIYTNAWSKLAPGRCRYGLMLRDDGMVFDDGVTACLADDHFHMTTTTGGAPRVLDWLEEWLQTEWPDLEVYCTSVTEQWATMAVSGPKAREVLAPLVEDLDLSPDSLPHMGFASATIAGVAGRIFRISFTGEMGFEVNVPAGYGAHVWRALVDAGAPHGLTIYGTEAMHLLRAEKGFIIVGQDTDGTVTPGDLGMDWIVSQKKGDFLGRRSLRRPDMLVQNRKQLVGLLTKEPDFVLEEGSQLVEQPGASVPIPMIGHVTSSYMSPNAGRSVALALVQNARGRMGETIFVPLPDGKAMPVELVSPVFIDPEGTRLDG